MQLKRRVWGRHFFPATTIPCQELLSLPSQMTVSAVRRHIFSGNLKKLCHTLSHLPTIPGLPLRRKLNLKLRFKR